MNWGYRILFAYVAFVLIMVSMVFFASKQKNDMIDDNYYDKELKYQSQIDAEKNLLALHDSVQVIQESQALTVNLPIAESGKPQEGKMEFLRPSDENKDVVLPLALNEQGVQSIPINKFSRGMYKLRLSWTGNGKPYFYEKQVFVQ